MVAESKEEGHHSWTTFTRLLNRSVAGHLKSVEFSDLEPLLGYGWWKTLAPFLIFGPLSDWRLLILGSSPN